MGQHMTKQRDDQAPMLHREPPDIDRRPIDDSGEKVVMRFRRFCVIPRTRQVFADGQPLDLGSRAFDLLVALLEARGALLTKNEIMDRVWPTTVVDESNLRVQMVQLRRALGKDRDLIKNVPGRGYILAVAPDGDSDDPRASPAPGRFGHAAMAKHTDPTNSVHERLREAQLQLARVARLATVVGLTASAAHEVTERLTAIVANAQGCLLRLAGDRADQVGAVPVEATRSSAASKVTRLRPSSLDRDMLQSARAIS